MKSLHTTHRSHRLLKTPHLHSLSWRHACT